MYPSFPGSLEDTRDRIQTGLSASFRAPYPGAQQSPGGPVNDSSVFCIEAIYPDLVLAAGWVDASGAFLPSYSGSGTRKYFSIPYSDDDGEIQFGDPQEVKLTVKVEPAEGTDEAIIASEGGLLESVGASHEVLGAVGSAGLPSLLFLLNEQHGGHALHSLTRMFGEIASDPSVVEEAARSEAQRKAMFAKMRGKMKGTFSRAEKRALMPTVPSSGSGRSDADHVKSMAKIMDMDQPGAGKEIIADALATLSKSQKAGVFSQWGKLSPRDQKDYLIGEPEKRDKLEKKYKALQPLGAAIDDTF